MTASSGEIIKSWGSSSRLEPLPYINVYSNGLETKYISLRGLLRPGINNSTLAMQAVGTTITPYLSLYTPNAKEDPSNFPWHEYSPILPSEIRQFYPAFGFYLKLIFTSKGHLIISSL